MRKILHFAVIVMAIIICVFPKSVMADLLSSDFRPVDIIVNGELIQSPNPFAKFDQEGGIVDVMVPLRAVADALGVSVDWRETDQRILINGNTEIWINRTQFYIGIYFAGNLGFSPEIVNGNTFVPLSFFDYVLNGFETRISENAIFIDTLPYFVYREPYNIVTATFNLADDGDALSMSVNDINIGHSEQDGTGFAVFSFLRLPFGADFMPDEISSAWLNMKVAENDEISENNIPSSISVAFITEIWNTQTLTVSEAVQIGNNAAATNIPTNYNDGWVSLDITDFVRGWLSGEQQNNGLSLSPVYGDSNVSFISGNDGSLEVPYITVIGQIGERSTEHGAFPFFHKRPVEDLAHTDYYQTAGGGNCLAFALRDLNPITMEQLDFEYEEIDQKYLEGGQEAVLEFVAQSIETYVANNSENLRISNFRRIENFDSPIQPDTEYRIALRVGTNAPEGMNFNQYNFDFHLWSQIDDGRWSQKFPLNYSEIIPGTAHDIDPAEHHWHSARQWGVERFQNFYTGRIIYFAVTKDVDIGEFTSHRGE